MLSDIWETPEVLKHLLSQYLPEAPGGGGSPSKGGEAASPWGVLPPKLKQQVAAAPSGCSVHFPSLHKPLPATHGLAGRTPMEVMASCGGAKNAVRNKIIIVGCGTSYHASVLAEYLIETIARIPVEVQYSGEFRYQRPVVRSGDVVILVSNSGETAETVDCLRMLKKYEDAKGVLIMGIVNQVESTIAREADVHICSLADREAGTACTKVFSATAVVFVLLAMALGETLKVLSKEDYAILDRLRELPDLIEKVIERESHMLRADSSAKPLEIGACQLWDIGCQNVLANNFIYLGRGFNFPIALEGAMKCKEIAYIHAEGYPAAEMKHGPIALIDQFMPVVVIAPRADPTYEKIKANIEEVKARSGSTIAITEDGNHELDEICEYVIHVPETHEYLFPLVALIPLQLLSCMMGVLRGNEVDKPRGLQKVVSGRFADEGGATPPANSSSGGGYP